MTVKYITKILRDAITEHVRMLGYQSKYRYVNDGQLISTHTYTDSYYPRPYNKEVFDFCVGFFEKIKAEGILIDIQSDHPNFLRVSFPETVDMKKIAKELKVAVEDHFDMTWTEKDNGWL